MRSRSKRLRNVRKAALFVSAAPSVSRRYRCDHQAEQIALLGASVDVAVYDEIDLTRVSDHYALVVLHRVPWAADVEALFNAAKAHGRTRIVFDTDDLVFDIEVMKHVAALESMAPSEVRLYEEGLRRYRRTLARAGAATVTTEALAAHTRRVVPDVTVSPNVASRAMVAAAIAIRGGAIQSTRNITIGYFSGTHTHDRDFLEAAEALLWMLEARPSTRLRIVGPLRLDRRFGRFNHRIERLPFMSYERLTTALAAVDVNIAPLEPRNPFTDSKSSVKWVEASLVGVPTIASPRPDYRRVITNGKTGLLADTVDEWKHALEELLDKPQLRAEIGQNARREVLRAHTTIAEAPKFYAQMRRLAGGTKNVGPLTINWIMQAPIAQHGGGYRNIFRIAGELASRGHVQRICIDPIAHLSGLSGRQIRDFVDHWFGVPSNAEVIVGHRRIKAADVSIATGWPTAPIVAAHQQSLFRAYFIQDFEPEFYEQGDRLYIKALRTYQLPLRHICLGTHLAARLAGLTGLPAERVDFAIDPQFCMTATPESRGEAPRVLFFARPSLRRRGYEHGLEALRLVKEAHPDVEIMFFGSPSEELGAIPFEAKNLGVLDAHAVAAAMNEAHILLTLSLTNISNVPFEGMACGCAVVDVDLPNVAAMVEAGRNCLLAPLEPREIARSVTTLIDDRDLRVRLGNQGAADGRTRTWTRTADMFEESLRELCFARLDEAFTSSELTSAMMPGELGLRRRISGLWGSGRA